MLDLTLYRPLASVRIPASNRKLAEAVLDYCVKDLRLKGLDLVWFRRSLDPQDRAGFVAPEWPRVVWLLDDLTPAEIVATVAHEARHCWQLHLWGELGATRPGMTIKQLAAGQADRERDAEHYERRIAALFGFSD